MYIPLATTPVVGLTLLSNWASRSFSPRLARTNAKSFCPTLRTVAQLTLGCQRETSIPTRRAMSSRCSSDSMNDKLSLPRVPKTAMALRRAPKRRLAGPLHYHVFKQSAEDNYLEVARRAQG